MIRFTFAAALLLAVASGAWAGELMAHDAWVPQPPPGSPAAAYLMLHNTGAEAVRVTGVRCAAAEKASLHETRVEDGVAKMVPVEVIEVPAGGSVDLAPRGLHVMLMGPTLPDAGESVELVLELEGGGTLEVAAEVRAPAHDGGHEDHSEH